MKPTESPKPSARKTVFRNMSGTQKTVIGCFGIWCAAQVASQYVEYKTLATRLALETLKATTKS